MKTLVAFIFLIGVSTQADDLGKEVWTAFSKTAVSTVKTEVMRQGLNKLGEQAFQQSNVGTGVFAAYGLYTAGDQFLKAESDSAKYYAATQAAAAVIGYINPALGLLVTLGNMGQQLLGDWATLDDQKQIAKLLEEIQDIQEQIQNAVEHMVDSDVVLISSMYAHYSQLLLQVSSYGNYLREFCQSQDLSENPSQTLKCLDVTTRIHYSKRALVAQGYKMVHFKGSFISFEQFMKASLPDADPQLFMRTLDKMASQFAQEKDSLDKMLKSAVQVTTSVILKSIQQKRNTSLESICVLEIQKRLNVINGLEVQMLQQKGNPQVFEQILLQMALELHNAQKFNQDVCEINWETAKPRTISFFKTLQSILGQKNPEMYLSQIEELP